MELWIRSQDRERLIKTNNIEKQDYYSYKEVLERYMPPNAISYDSMKVRTVNKKDKYLKSVIKCDEISLGEYKTKERALEVLDEIQNKIRPEYMLRSINSPDEPSQYEGYYEEKPIIIYEMPQK